MEIKFERQGTSLTAAIIGEIDHHTASFARYEIDSMLLSERPEKLFLDFGGVSFMDSSGIGLVMGRYKKALPMGIALEVVNVPENIYKVMNLSGIGKIANIKRKEK